MTDSQSHLSLSEFTVPNSVDPYIFTHLSYAPVIDDSLTFKKNQGNSLFSIYVHLSNVFFVGMSKEKSTPHIRRRRRVHQ